MRYTRGILNTHNLDELNTMLYFVNPEPLKVPINTWIMLNENDATLKILNILEEMHSLRRVRFFTCRRWRAGIAHSARGARSAQHQALDEVAAGHAAGQVQTGGDGS